MSLNSKKSWHPGKTVNRAKVAKLEEDQETQKRLATTRQHELSHERELADLRTRARGSRSASKLEWMYDLAPKVHAIDLELAKIPQHRSSPENSSSKMHRLSPPARKGSPPIDKTAMDRLKAADPFFQLAKSSKLSGVSKVPRNYSKNRKRTKDSKEKDG